MSASKSERDGATVSLVGRRSIRDGHVAVGVTLKAHGWSNDRVQISGSTELTTAQARSLAQSLVVLADEADAKVERKAATEARRRQWRNREIAAGRMVVFGGIRE